MDDSETDNEDWKDSEIEHLRNANIMLADALKEIFRNHGEDEDIGSICNPVFMYECS